MGYEEVRDRSHQLSFGTLVKQPRPLIAACCAYPDISAPHIRSNGWGTSLMSAMHVAALPWPNKVQTGTRRRE